MIITEIPHFSSKIIRFQVTLKSAVEFTCALEFKISSQRKNSFLKMCFLLQKKGELLHPAETGEERRRYKDQKEPDANVPGNRF